MKTYQETFNIVYNAILKQGCLSLDDKGYCLYRGPNGTKCAAGHLIPDDKYDPKMENKPCWRTGREGNEDLENLIITNEITNILCDEGYDPSFVRKLQHMHDSSYSLHEWLDNMLCLAMEYGISI